ncbi:virulence factor SrfB [Azospirillum doebereinerae]|uniref:Virulence factor SrfB n=1 Tax=Azospirillum doebereinerae TaxID=92933 RepID=A0A3S0VFL0_9PROT|nr:virulence factor SrfB [Azospirillum doebereinerae]RUQ66357.1 hypothetical protein EJ913_22850 [Azospirillum doebereinerae]
MLKSLFRWQKGSVVTLIPNTGIQFLDFAVTAAFAGQVQQHFYCEVRATETDADGRPAEVLHIVRHDEDKQPYYLDPASGLPVAVAEDEVFPVRGEQALDMLAGAWLPAPVLRVREDGAFADGPTNWARLFVTRLPEPDADGNRWRVTLALDTLLAERPGDHRYIMPEPRDAAEMTPFGLATGLEDVNFFLRTEWVRSWLRDSYLAAESARRGGRKVTLENLPRGGLYWATYLVLLKILGSGDAADRPVDAPEGPILPRLRFLDEAPYARDQKPIPVNLVIDIGNSRTCGILIEDSSEGAQRLDMSQAYRLELRDLSNPAHTYADPFESRVEFHTANFNLGAYSRMSGRPVRDAFWWPSPVRVGPEAAWLGSLTDGTQGRSGLSSPKRYLWDRTERTTPWVNNGGLLPAGERVPPIRGPIPAKLTQRGDLLKPGGLPGMKPAYSRSSLYMLMLTEILAHALIQINAPSTRAHRARSEEPRVLRNVILTVPSATPVAEQKALKRLAKWAINLLWEVMGWDAAHPLRRRPDLKTEWDEATATHLVYLYNEITQKLQSAPRDFFTMMRRNRQESGHRPMLRIASMDMGGGTTDLMIIQHEVTDNDRTIQPIQLFREGFRLAGDDILKQVIEDEVLPCLQTALAEAGAPYPVNFLVERFSSEREGMSQQERTLRALFVNQVLRPAALALLAQYENGGRHAGNDELTLRLVDAFPADRQPRRAVVDYLVEAARRSGARDFSLESVVVQTRRDRIAATIRGVVRPMLTDMCDVVRSYDCDVLLLSGRPSRFPVIKDMIIGQAPLPPSRIVPMDSYGIGNWYPFHSPTFKIEDPKTTAAVGAMLCQVCEGQVEGMLVRTSDIRMRSTARYIGAMEINDQIRTEKLVFSDVDLDRKEHSTSRTVTVTPPVFIGYRQLPLERWKTTPLYFLDFRNSAEAGKLAMPLSVTLDRRNQTADEDEGALEEFELREIKDANGQDASDQLRLSFQTLRVERGQEAGYWLDSGLLSMNSQG